MKTKLSLLLTTTFLGLSLINLNAQIAINNTATNPDASAILDLKSGNTGVNKGFLPNQVALVNVTMPIPVTTPATGLIVYSTSAPTGGNGTGYYYWTGTVWASLNSTLFGSGTTNYVARWSPNGNTLGTGVIQDNGSGVGIDTLPVIGNSLFVNAISGNGIYGYSKTGTGIYGNGLNYGIYGNSPAFVGVYGQGVTVGGYFTASGGVGVHGDGTTYGGHFIASNGQGVFTQSTNAAGDSSIGITYGVYGYSSQGDGIRGVGSAFGNGVSGSAISGDGVYGSSANSAGVYGNGYLYGGIFTSMKGKGVLALGSGPSGEGVYSSSSNAAGDSSIGATYGVYGYSINTGIFGMGGNLAFLGEGNGVTSITGVPANTGNAFNGTSYGLFAAQTTNTNTGVAAIYAEDAKTSGNVQVNAWSGGTHYKVLGSFAGTVSCAVKDLNGDKVVMHCPETPEFYFEDYGEGQLVNGKAHIDLDPILAKNVAINEKHPLRVYIELLGDCNGTYITNRTASGFDVIELKGGTSNTSFQWHVICNVKDENENGVINHNQDLRFEKAPIIDTVNLANSSKSTTGILGATAIPPQQSTIIQQQNPAKK